MKKEKIDILLINPQFSVMDTIRSLKQKTKKESKIYLYPPLGIAYLASSLIKKGFNTKIIDSVGLSLEKKGICSEIKKINPKNIGITVTTHTLNSSYLLIKEIRKFYNGKIIVGGPHITYDPKSFEHLNSDFGFIGEAEENIPKLINLLKKENEKQKINIYLKFSKIEGLIYKNKKNKIIYNKRAHVKNLDKLPFPKRDLLPNENYFFSIYTGKFTTIITSRGCVFDCVYCALPDKKKIRTRSIENVIKELTELVKEGYSYIDFQDDFFTFDKKRTIKLCDQIIKNKFKFKWGCATRIEFVDENLLKLMKKAGCHNIRYGIESGSSKIRLVIGKTFSDKKIIEIIKKTKKAKIKAIALFSLGHPTETKKDMIQTYKFSKKIKADYIQFALINIIPGSRLFNIALNCNMITKDIWYHVSRGKIPPTFIPQKTNLNFMRKIQGKALIRHYLNPIYTIKNLMDSRSFDDFLNKIKIGLAIFRNFIKT